MLRSVAMVNSWRLMLLWNFSNSLQIKTSWIRQKELDNRFSLQVNSLERLTGMNWPVDAGNGEGSLQESDSGNGGYWKFCATGKTSPISGVQLSLFYHIRMWNMLTIRHPYPTYITIHIKKSMINNVSCRTDTAESL